MQTKYIASMLSEGNHLFQASITILDDGIVMRIPKFWKDKETFVRFEDISGFRIDTPSWYSVLSYCTIYMNAHGTWVEAHGFTKSDAQKIKMKIEDGQKIKIGRNLQKSLGDRKHKSHEELKNRSRNDHNEFLKAVGQFAEERRIDILELIDNIKKNLTQLLTLLYLYNNLGDRKMIAETQEKIVSYKKQLYKQLKIVGEESNFETIVDECRYTARGDADKEIKKSRQSISEMIDDAVNETFQVYQGNDNTSNFEFDDLDLGIRMASIQNLIINQVNDLARDYDNLNIELLEDNLHVENDSKLVSIMISNIIRGKVGREFIRNEFEKTEYVDYKYFIEIKTLLEIINKIYNSIVYQQIEDGKEGRRRIFPFGLDKSRIKDYLKDEDVSLCDKMSKLIDVVDNFIDRVDKNIK